MLVRRLYQGLVVLVIAGVGQRVCDAQAFFPLERLVTSAAQSTYVKVEANAAAIVGPDLVSDAPPAIESNLSDPNYVTDPESNAAVAGSSVATSDGNPVAETLPAETAWALLAESAASIGGIWSLTTGSGPSLAAINNEQWAEAEGDFIVLVNPTYPTVTAGTLQIEFNLINSSDYDHVYMHVSCNDSYLEVLQGPGNYIVMGYLEGYGNVMDYDNGPFPGGVYTAYRPTYVGDTPSTYAYVSGDLDGGWSITSNSAASGSASISATTSIYATNP